MIRIGEPLWRQRHRTKPVRISFFATFFSAGLVGEKACLSLPPNCLQWHEDGPVAQLDRASHYGCEGLGFESLQGHKKKPDCSGSRVFCGVKILDLGRMYAL